MTEVLNDMEDNNNLSNQLCQLTDEVKHLTDVLSKLVDAISGQNRGLSGFDNPVAAVSKTEENPSTDLKQQNDTKEKCDFPLLYAKGKSSNQTPPELVEIGEKLKAPFIIHRDKEISGSYAWNSDISQETLSELQNFWGNKSAPFCSVDILGNLSLSELFKIKTKKEGRVEKRDDKWIIVEKLELTIEK